MKSQYTTKTTSSKINTELNQLAETMSATIKNLTFDNRTVDWIVLDDTRVSVFSIHLGYCVYTDI